MDYIKTSIEKKSIENYSIYQKKSFHCNESDMLFPDFIFRLLSKHLQLLFKYHLAQLQQKCKFSAICVLGDFCGSHWRN